MAKTIQQQLYMDNWPRRRRWMVVILTWMLGNAQYLIIWGQDNALHQNALITLIGAIVAVLGSYVFGATWDDTSKRAQIDQAQVVDRELTTDERAG